MSQQKVFDSTKSKKDNDSFGPDPSWDQGIDTHTVSIPRGKKFVRYEFVNLSSLGSTEIIQKPRAGAAGRIKFKVKWNYLLFGEAKYRLQVYAGTSQTISINVSEPNWDQKVRNAIEQKIPLKLTITGISAATIGNIISNRSTKEINDSYEKAGELQYRVEQNADEIIDRDPVTITAIAITAAAITLIAIAGFITLAFAIKNAVDAGLCISAKHKINGPNPFDDELTIDIKKC